MTIPGQPAPALCFNTVAHGRYDLAQDVPHEGTLVIFYRGLHCPLCRRQIKELDDRIGDFALRGVRLVALSGDSQNRAAKLIEDTQIIRLPIGYGLDMKTAHDDWGLFLSEAREGTEEPALFSEPGLYWIRSDGNISFAVIHSLPFMRPSVDQILKAIDFALSKGSPPRGAFTGNLQS